MKKDLRLILTKLLMLLFWVIEALIAWTTCGLVLIFCTYLVLPQIGRYLQLLLYSGTMGIVLLGFILPTLIGICLNSLGLVIFDIVAKSAKFFARVEEKLPPQFHIEDIRQELYAAILLIPSGATRPMVVGALTLSIAGLLTLILIYSVSISIITAELTILIFVSLPALCALALALRVAFYFIRSYISNNYALSIIRRK